MNLSNSQLALNAVTMTEKPRAAAYVPTNHDIREHMHLVYKVVGRLQRKLPSSFSRQEQIAAGSIGLLDALSKHDGDLGTPSFECYARIRIQGAIMDELRLLDWSPRRTKSNAAAAAATPSRTAAAPVVIVGIEDLTPGQEPSTDAASPQQATEAVQLRHAVEVALARLPERDRKVLELRYVQDVPAKDVAMMLGVSEARVSQLHARATGTLRVLLAEFEDGRKAA
jgi:RNA polymerase sigma factor for flagellar operon FliA